MLYESDINLHVSVFVRVSYGYISSPSNSVTFFSTPSFYLFFFSSPRKQPPRSLIHCTLHEGLKMTLTLKTRLTTMPCTSLGLCPPRREGNRTTLFNSSKGAEWW
jgi:hypothetical protein